MRAVHSCKSWYSYFITPYDSQASSAFSALINILHSMWRCKFHTLVCFTTKIADSCLHVSLPYVKVRQLSVNFTCSDFIVTCEYHMYEPSVNISPRCESSGYLSEISSRVKTTTIGRMLQTSRKVMNGCPKYSHKCEDYGRLSVSFTCSNIAYLYYNLRTTCIMYCGGCMVWCLFLYMSLTWMKSNFKLTKMLVWIFSQTNPVDGHKNWRHI